MLYDLYRTDWYGGLTHDARLYLAMLIDRALRHDAMHVEMSEASAVFTDTIGPFDSPTKRATQFTKIIGQLESVGAVSSSPVEMRVNISTDVMVLAMLGRNKKKDEPPQEPRGTRVDKGFTDEVARAGVEWAAASFPGEFGPQDMNNQLAAFRDYWLSIPGSKGVKLDWAATWRTWIRKEVDRRQITKRYAETPGFVRFFSNWPKQTNRVSACNEWLQAVKNDFAGDEQALLAKCKEAYQNALERSAWGEQLQYCPAPDRVLREKGYK